PDGETELPALSPAVPQDEHHGYAQDDSEDPAHRPAERAGGPTPDQDETGIVGRDGRAAAEDPHDATEAEQTAQGDDEGRDPDVGDDEALQPADERAEADPEREGDDPADRMVDPDRARKDVGHQHGIGHADDPDERADRQVDGARHDDHEHPGRDDRDRRSLDRQGQEVDRLQEPTTRGDAEADEDERERGDHAEQAQIDLGRPDKIAQAPAFRLRDLSRGRPGHVTHGIYSWPGYREATCPAVTTGAGRCRSLDGE